MTQLIQFVKKYNSWLGCGVWRSGVHFISATLRQNQAANWVWQGIHWNYDTFWIHFIGAPGIIRNFPLMISSTTRDREDLLGICHCNWQQTSESTIVRPRRKCSQSLDWIGFATNLLPTKSGRVGETGLLAGWPPTKLPSFFVPRWLGLHICTTELAPVLGHGGICAPRPRPCILTTIWRRKLLTHFRLSFVWENLFFIESNSSLYFSFSSSL